MKQSSLKKKVLMSGMALSMAVGMVQVVPFAKPMSIFAQVTAKETPNGVANFGSGLAHITIKPYNNQSLVGKEFVVYKLFNAQNSLTGESINYTWNPTYKVALQNIVGPKLSPAKEPSTVTEYEVIDYIQKINTHKVEGATAPQQLEGRYSAFRYFVEDLRDEIVKLNINGEKVKVTQVALDGSVKFSGLDFGYYLTDEVSATPSQHAASSLCMVNTANPDAEVQIKSDFPYIIKKINEDDNKIGWNDIADYEIGQTVPYKYESAVPNMNGYKTYFFSFHDKMDTALTFKKETLTITISDSAKTYTLQPAEFEIVENQGGDTFEAKIADLKAIVDREFDKKNSEQENTYGQKIEVRYDAVLNENARLDTGRPGFENDVYLEFSNNPDKGHEDEKGKTPLDTVVCFTYKLNVTKENDKQAKLEGAKFRLYSDKACLNEVFVKETPEKDGYIVINRDSVGGTDHTGGQTPTEAVEMVSPKGGKFVIYGLDQGTYWLKETQAPDGYRQLLDPIELKLTPTFTDDRQNYVKGDGATDKTLQTLAATAVGKEFYNGTYTDINNQLTTDVAQGSANITVVNKVGSKLPVTGSNMTLIMLSSGVAIMTASMMMNKRRREE